ncbi:DNA double-strand break repair nuclease NurA [Desulfurobacterium sp.]
MSIKGYLIELAEKKKNSITTDFETISLEAIGKASELWKEFEGEEIKATIGAVDGSLNKKEFLGFVVFAVAASSVFFNESGKNEERESYNIDIDVLKPSEYSDSRIRLFMGILEIKELLKLYKEENPDIMLIDGSIVGDIIRPVSFTFQIEDEEREYVENCLFPELKETFSLNSINSRAFHEKIVKDVKPEKYPVIAGYLEYLEYLLSIEKLLNVAEDRIVAISKRSSSKIYNFNSIMPDIFIFQMADVPSGYSNPVEVEISPEKKYRFPEIFEDSFRKRKINVFFAKFTTDVYKIETNLQPEKVMGALKGTIVRNYPYPLKLAHDSVKIDNHTMEKIISVLSIHFRTGREGVD